MTYTCLRNGRTYKRIRIGNGGAKAWRGVPWFLRSEVCWNCEMSDCVRNHKKHNVEAMA